MKMNWIAVAVLGGASVVPGALAQSTGSMGLGAQGTMSAQGGVQVAPSKVYGDLLRSMEQEIVGAAEVMPEDKYNFAPPASDGNFAGVRTFGDEVKHLAGGNYAFFAPFGVGGKPDMSKMKAMTSKAEIVQTLKDSYAYAEKAVDSITPENAFAEMKGGMHADTRAGSATFALAHSMDHYGQLVEYLRMNGIVPPASQKKGM